MNMILLAEASTLHLQSVQQWEKNPDKGKQASNDLYKHVQLF